MLTPLPIPAPPDFRWPSSFNRPLPCAVPGLGGAAFFSEGRAQSGVRPFYHKPVLYREVVQYLEPAAGRSYLDGTLGGGGHSGLLLEKGATVRGIDRDPEAREYARLQLAAHGSRFEIVAGRFGDMAALAKAGHWSLFDGILLDIGVSSRQLDAPERGFSFQKEGPLDMRMGEEGSSAADLVNTASESELAQIIYEFGEEKASRRIAAWIISERKKTPFARTLQLAEGIEKLLGRRGKIHPATKTFQALRMAVNDELGELQRALTDAPSLLKPGGVLAVITFHSLEDRLVKRFFKNGSQPEIDRPEWPAPRPNPNYQFDLLTRKAVVARPDELAENPRARSAKLRVVKIV